jgi:predicted transcriptional regulator of viral defense system
MKWQDFLERFGNEIIFESGSIAVGEAKSRNIQNRLYQWVLQGKLIQLRRGIYTFCEPYRKEAPSSELIANRLVYPSYISLTYALFFYNLIPEGVFTVTNVTTYRGQYFANPFGRFRYRHISTDYFWGYYLLDQGSYQISIAYPEKAILDFFYFLKGETTSDRIAEMRFQNLEQLSAERMIGFLRKFNRPKLYRIMQLAPFNKFIK